MGKAARTSNVSKVRPGDNRRAEDLLRSVVEGTAATAGAEFFRSLVKHVATSLNVQFVFVAECLPNLRARSLAVWTDGKFGDDFEYDLPGTPCLEVTEGRTCHHPDHIQELFPKSKALIDLGILSFLGVPVRDSTQRVVGHLVIMDDKPMPRDPLVLPVIEVFAARAGVELERARAFEDLHRLHEESEERFRDLFDEAPIAYVHEGLDSRIIRANRAAMRILGITPEEVVGTYGKSFAPNTPDAQQRLREAFESIGRGTDTSGVVLELRRKDNGKPIWVQWWSKPDPSGSYTRTMLIDITEQVLMEQEKARLEAQNKYLREEIRAEHNFAEIVGNSPKLRAVLQQVEQVASTDSTALICGETGTGKELVARAIHNRSPRKERPLVKVNCGAISAGLVESELFGHVKGAFTGALASRDGRFKVADGGTIFLDEVGELPLETQVKLLRVLQEQEFEPIGSDTSVRVDVRIIAATSRNLDEMVRAGRFRADLLYRLNVFPIYVPPLRERQGDVPLLVAFFLQSLSKKLGKKVTQVSEETMRRLVEYPWPGNIRELQNVIERAVILSGGNVLAIDRDFLPMVTMPPSSVSVPSSSATSPPVTASLKDAEQRHIESVLARAGWVIEGEHGAAKMLKLHPNTLRSRMKKLGIQRPSDPAA